MIARGLLFWLTLGLACWAATNAAGQSNAAGINVTVVPAQRSYAGQQPVRYMTALPTQVVPGLGLQATIETEHVDYAGYVPITITLLPTAATFAADRTITFRFEQTASTAAPAGNIIRVDVPVTASQGAGVTTFRRMIPRYTYGDDLNVTMIENGRVIERGKSNLGTSLLRQSSIGQTVLAQEARLKILQLNQIGSGSSARPIPDPMLSPAAYQSKATALVLAEMRQALFDANSNGVQSANWKQVDAAVGPVDWRGYQRYSAVVLRQTTLNSLVSGKPDRLAALREWVLCGGTVVLLDCDSDDAAVAAFTGGTEASELPELRRRDPMHISAWDRFNQSVINVPQMLSNRSRPTIENWFWLVGKLPDNADPAIQRSFGDGGGVGSTYMMGSSYVDSASLVRDAKGKIIPLPEKEISDFKDALKQLEATRQSKIENPMPKKTPFGAGFIYSTVAGSPESPFDLTWPFMQAELSSPNRSAVVRRGVDPVLGDRRFYRWLIAGVAQPPVYTFMGLLFVFVILVGPVAYRLTTRTGRSYLMFAIAPILALLTTAAMLIYGVVADGFDVKVRQRKITFVDGQSGDAGQRWRTTYFAGLRPSEGLAFPGNAEIVPYRDSNGASWNDRMNESAVGMSTVRVDKDAQRFGIGFLPSRSQRQFVGHRPVSDFGVIQFKGEVEDGVATRQILNSTRHQFNEVVLCDVAGKYWVADGIPPRADGKDGRAVAELTPLIEVSKVLSKAFASERLQATVMENRRGNNRYQGYRQVTDLVQQTMGQSQGAYNLFDTENGLFESQLRGAMAGGKQMTRNSFVAVGDVEPDELAIKGCTVMDSVHFVVGTLP